MKKRGLSEQLQIRLEELASAEAGSRAADMAETIADWLATTDASEHSGAEILRLFAVELRKTYEAGEETVNGSEATSSGRKTRTVH